MGAVSQIETRYLLADEYPLWDSFVDESTDGTIFHKSDWLEPISSWQNLNFSIIACFKGGRITGGMAFTWKKKFGRIPVIQMPLKTPVFGPVISRSKAQYQSKAESHTQEVVKALTGFIMSEFQMFHAQFPPSVKDIRHYEWDGFKTGIHYTYTAELNPDTDIRASFDHAVRKQIKKAELSDYNFHAENLEKYISVAWELEQLSFNRQDFDMVYATRENFSSFISGLMEKELVQIYTICLEETPVASRIVILDHPKGKVYDWLAGADQNHLSTGLNQQLMYLVLVELQKSEFKLFDFGGAGTSSIARYKSSYNFPIVPMYSASKERGVAQLGSLLKKLR